MIGSKRKREQFEHYAAERGIAREMLRQKLICPMGIEGINGRRPAEIAIAIAAQILLVWEQSKTTSSGE
jgi:xanthine dehydrogenase accessory factor